MIEGVLELANSIEDYWPSSATNDERKGLVASQRPAMSWEMVTDWTAYILRTTFTWHLFSNIS